MIGACLDLLGVAVLGLLLAAAAAPAWVGVLGLALIAGGLLTLGWLWRGRVERHRAERRRPEPQPLTVDTAMLRSHERRPRTHRAPAHPDRPADAEDDPDRTVVVPAVYGGSEPESTRVMYLTRPLRERGRRNG